MDNNLPKLKIANGKISLDDQEVREVVKYSLEQPFVGPAVLTLRLLVDVADVEL